jgi:hypothetical protein
VRQLSRHPLGGVNKMNSNQRNLYIYQPIAYCFAAVGSSAILALILILIYPSKVFLEQFWGILKLDLPPTFVVSLIAVPIVRKRFLTMPSEKDKGYLDGFLIKCLSCVGSFCLFLFIADYRFQPIDFVQSIALAYLFLPFFFITITLGVLTGAGINEMQK